ncbi:hypothetical protein ACS0TY_028052 [Phlomoides rotata]
MSARRPGLIALFDVDGTLTTPRKAFHVLYHIDQNVLLGAPTGSGKTISAELAMLHLFNTQPDMKNLLKPEEESAILDAAKVITHEGVRDEEQGKLYLSMYGIFMY